MARRNKQTEWVQYNGNLVHKDEAKFEGGRQTIGTKAAGTVKSPSFSTPSRSLHGKPLGRLFGWLVVMP